jgi:hypothetical protein
MILLPEDEEQDSYISEKSSRCAIHLSTATL